MKITKVCCQGCGAALDVDDSLRFVTCNYCHARLEVIHDPSTTHTRILEKLEKRTERLVDDVKVLQLQNDLEQLDREWDQYREAALVRGKNGSVSEPSVIGSVVSGVFAMVAGMVFASVASQMNGAFALVGLAFVGFGLFMIVSGVTKAKAFEEFRSRYEGRRAGLLVQIESARRR